MSTWTSHGGGILSKIHNGKRVFYVRFFQDGKRKLQQAGGTERQARTARATIKAQQIEARINGILWVSPKERIAAAQRAEQQAAELERSKSSCFTFEAVRTAFMTRHRGRYACPGDVEGMLAHLGMVFAGRRLDELKRPDVQQYIDNRLASSGPFVGKRGGHRITRREIGMLARLFSYLIEEQGHEGITNPCAGAWRHRDEYRPAHVKVTPTEEQRAALFAAADAFMGMDRKLKEGRQPHLMGALLRLAYFTGGRPESEYCALLHGDVQTGAGIVKMGDRTAGDFSVTFYGRDRQGPKDHEPRKVILKDEGTIQALLSSMLPEPTTATERAAWAATPIFRKRSGAAWDRSSYRRAWRSILSKAVEQHPTLAGMHLRDLRATRNTALVEAGIAPASVGQIQGNSAEMASGRYLKTTEQVKQAAASVR